VVHSVIEISAGLEMAVCLCSKCGGTADNFYYLKSYIAHGISRNWYSLPTPVVDCVVKAYNGLEDLNWLFGWSKMWRNHLIFSIF